MPIVGGFGITDEAAACRFHQVADKVIVGSAFIKIHSYPTE
ncbi:MAG: hypothetical protein WCT05_10925 [Lentisphaeria bacterium]